MLRLGAIVALAAACALSAAGTASGAAMSAPRAKAFVERLAAAGPRVAGSANERRAARLVAARLRALGYPVAIQTFPLPRGGTSRNVVARTAGPIRAVVVAHVDGVRASAAANDNGSGVAAMLEVAAALRGRDGVLVAALGAEERHETGSPLHLGSARLVRSLPPRTRSAIRLALSLDMVGVGSTLSVRGLERSPNRSSRRAIASGRAIGLDPRYLPDSGVSDHAELTRARIPAALVTWRWDACWHERCDRPARVSAKKLMAAARLTVVAARRVLPQPSP
jgi:Peptidase family M28